jgi:hypothetical protein
MEPVVGAADPGLTLFAAFGELGGSMAALEQALAAPSPAGIPRGPSGSTWRWSSCPADFAEHIAGTEDPAACTMPFSRRRRGSRTRSIGLVGEHGVIKGLTRDLLDRVRPPVAAVTSTESGSSERAAGRLVRHRQHGADLIPPGLSGRPRRRDLNHRRRPRHRAAARHGAPESPRDPTTKVVYNPVVRARGTRWRTSRRSTSRTRTSGIAGSRSTAPPGPPCG